MSNKSISDFIDKNDKNKEKLSQEEIEAKVNVILTSNLSLDESLILYTYGKLYISYKEDSDFQYTQINGIISLVINRSQSVLYIQIYELSDFKKQFEIELYTNVESGYTISHKLFHCIEYPSFFLGFQFPSENYGQILYKNLIIYSTLLNGKLPQFSYENGYETNTSLNRLNKKLKKNTIKIEKVENLISLYEERESGELIYDLSRAAYKVFEQYGVNAGDFNFEYEKIRDRLKNLKLMEEEESEEDEEDEEDDNNMNKNTGKRLSMREGKVKGKKGKKLNEKHIENIISAVNQIEGEEKEEEEEIEKIKCNALKRKNYMVRNENKVPKITLMKSKKFENLDYLAEVGSAGDESVGTKRMRTKRTLRK